MNFFKKHTLVKVGFYIVLVRVAVVVVFTAMFYTNPSLLYSIQNDDFHHYYIALALIAFSTPLYFYKKGLFKELLIFFIAVVIEEWSIIFWDLNLPHLNLHYMTNQEFIFTFTLSATLIALGNYLKK